MGGFKPIDPRNDSPSSGFSPVDNNVGGLSGFSPFDPNGSGGLVFDRQWTIGQLGDDYGYHVPNVYGGLVPNTWFNFIDSVDILIVDNSATATILQSDISSMWGISNDVTLQVEGFGDIILTWNGATAYINVGDSAFVNYIIGQLGNSIGVNILPKNNASPTAKREITTLLDNVITTLGDKIIHTGN